MAQVPDAFIPQERSPGGTPPIETPSLNSSDLDRYLALGPRQRVEARLRE